MKNIKIILSSFLVSVFCVVVNVQAVELIFGKLGAGAAGYIPVDSVVKVNVPDNSTIEQVRHALNNIGASTLILVSTGDVMGSPTFGNIPTSVRTARELTQYKLYVPAH